MKRRLRVLLLAESANPEWTSVPLEGWSHSKAISELCETHLVTQVRNTDAIVRAGWKKDIDFTAIDNESIAAPVHRVMSWFRQRVGLGWTFETASQSLSYYSFERQVWEKFGSSIKAHKFDVVHRLTPLSPTIPSFSLPSGCRLAGIPFVWGPVNGGLPWPKGFSGVLNAEGEWLSYIRNFHKLLPGYARTRINASAIIVGSQSARDQFRNYQDRTVYIPENAVDLKRFPSVSKVRFKPPLRIAFVGRLVPYKGADMLILAAADLVKAKKIVIDIIGDGPEMAPLLALCRSLDLGDGVNFLGWVPHEKLQEVLVRSSVFGFPSVREFGGAVILEAMATGLVPIVVGYGGPNEIVSDTTGIRVPLSSREEIITGFRRAIESLLENPSSLKKMADRSRERVKLSFTWEVKAAQVLEVYHWVLGERDRPVFELPPNDHPNL